MFNHSKLNSAVEERLHRKYPHKVDFKYGLDVDSFKGVEKFPLSNFESHFTSNAKPNVDSYLFHTNQIKEDKRFDIPISKKYAPPQAEPFRFNEPVKNPMPQRKNFGSFVSKIYGMPKDKDIIIESTAAQTMNLEHGGLTETKFMIHNWRKEFGGDGRFIDLISGKQPNAEPHDDNEGDESQLVESDAEESKAEKSKEAAQKPQTIRIPKPKVTANPAFEKEIVTEPKRTQSRSNSPQREPHPLVHRTLLVKSAKESNDESSEKEINDESSEKEIDEPTEEELILRSEIFKQINDLIAPYERNLIQEVPPEEIEEINKILVKDGFKPLSKQLKKLTSIRTAVRTSVESKASSDIVQKVKNAPKEQKKIFERLFAEAEKEARAGVKTVQKKGGETISTKDINLDV